MSKEFLIQLRNYFGENDKTSFEHMAFGVIDREIKALDVAAGEQCFKEDDVENIYNENVEGGFLGHGTLARILNTRATAYAAQQNRELLTWKESAMKVLSAVDDQEIGKLLGVPLGHSISDNLLEKIKAYRLDGVRRALEKARVFTDILFEGPDAVPVADWTYTKDEIIESITNPKNLEV